VAAAAAAARDEIQFYRRRRTADVVKLGVILSVGVLVGGHTCRDAG